jgi:hypothetical protein
MMTDVSVRLLVPTLVMTGGVESGGSTRLTARLAPAATVTLVAEVPRSAAVAVTVQVPGAVSKKANLPCGSVFWLRTGAVLMETVAL